MNRGETRAKRTPGEYLPLVWDDDQSCIEVVIGHVTPEVFRAALCGKGVDTTALGETEHLYARFIPRRGRDYDNEFVICEKGPGAFPVTVAT